MKMKTWTFRLIVAISMLVHPCAVYSQLDEVEKVAKKYVHYPESGNPFVMSSMPFGGSPFMLKLDDDRHVIEFNELAFRVEALPLTAADKLNGMTTKAVVNLTASAFRSGKMLPDQTMKEWSEWMDSSSGEPVFRFLVQRRNDEWQTLAQVKHVLGWMDSMLIESSQNTQDHRPKKVAAALANLSGYDGKHWSNSLGMKFIAIPRSAVALSIWETRVKDYEAFVLATNHDSSMGVFSVEKGGWKKKGNTWKSPGFEQTGEHPVVGICWRDAKAFCEWLTKKEQVEGLLPRGARYRLPLDLEWSAAVGVFVMDEEGKEPKDRDEKVQRMPWGKAWPPPAPGKEGGLNMAGEEYQGNIVGLEGYRDTFPWTSPVGSFPASSLGLYDLFGNAAELCEEAYDSTQPNKRTERGGSCHDSNKGAFLISQRGEVAETQRGTWLGFRCALDLSVE